MNENARTAMLIATLNSIDGCRAKKRHGGKFQMGDADVAGVYNGKAFFIESKMSDGVLSELQASELTKWQEVGATTAVVVFSKELGKRGKDLTRVIDQVDDMAWPAGSVKSLAGVEIGLGRQEWETWLKKHRDPELL